MLQSHYQQGQQFGGSFDAGQQYAMQQYLQQGGNLNPQPQYPGMGQQYGGAEPMPPPEPEGAIATPIDYKTVTLSHPNYRLGIVRPLSGGQAYTIAPTSTQEIIFELGTSVWNLAQSYLEFEWGVPLTTNAYTVAFENSITFFSSIYLLTRTGIYICQLEFANQVIGVMNDKEMSVSELMQLDTATAPFSCSQLTGPNNLRPTVTGFSTSPVNNTEVLYMTSSALGAALGNIERIPLRLIKNTIFALNRNLLFGEVINLRLLAGPGSNITYTCTGLPNTGVLTQTNNLFIQNIQLLLAYEQDAQIISTLREQLNQGFSFPIPFVYVQRNLVTGGAQTPNVRYNRGNGIVLRKFIYTAFAPTTNLNFVYDRDNCVSAGAVVAVPAAGASYTISAVGSTKVQQYYTTINNARIEDLQLSVANWDDYLFNMIQLRYSMTQQANSYRFNWFHSNHFDSQQPVLSDFQDTSGLGMYADQDSLVCGIALNNSELLYQVNGQVISAVAYPPGQAGAQQYTPSTSGLNHMIIGCTRKILTCSPTTTSCL